jgi:hypothetical protein
MQLKARRFGFRQFPDHIAIESLAPEDFETQAGAKRDAIVERMNAYFRQRIPMFPDEIQRFHWGAKHWPKLFDALSDEFIGEAFPDDDDLREIVKTFKDACLHNIARVIYLKRRWQLIAVLFAAAYLALSHFYLESHVALPPVAFLALKGAVLAAIAGVYWVFFRVVEDSYNAALESSAKGFVNVVQKRMNDLFNAFTSFGKQIDQAENKPGDWADSAKWWTKVLLWLSKRMEYIEKSIQLELWRIRVWHWLTNRRGVVLLYLFAVLPLLVLGSAALVAGALGSRAFASPSLLLDAALWAGFSIVLAWISNRVANTAPNFLSSSIDTSVWKLYGDLDLHEVLGEQVARDKRRILEELNRHKPSYPLQGRPPAA